MKALKCLVSSHFNAFMFRNPQFIALLNPAFGNGMR